MTGISVTAEPARDFIGGEWRAGAEGDRFDCLHGLEGMRDLQQTRHVYAELGCL